MSRRDQAKQMATNFLESNGNKDAAAFLSDRRGQVDSVRSGAIAVVSLVVALTVGALVASFLMPIGITELAGVDTSNWSSGAEAMWNILDVIIVLALFLFFIGLALAAVKFASG